MTKISQKCINSQSLVHIDIKSYSIESVVSIINNLYQIESKHKEFKYLGPKGINNLILEKESSSIGSIKLIKFLKSKKNINPFLFFQYYKLIVEFLDYCSTRLNKIPVNINDFDLYNKSLFLDFVSVKQLSNIKIKEFNKLYRLFFQSESILCFLNEENKSQEFNHVLLIRHLDLLKKECTNGSLQRRKRDYINFLNWIISVFKKFNSYSINSIPLYLITKDHLEEYKVFLISQFKEGTYQKHTISDVFYNVRSLFAYLYQMELIPHDITSNLSGIKFEKYKYRDVPSDEQLSDFFKAVLIYTPNPKKFQLAYKLMLYLGLRQSEVAYLESTNVNLSTQTISILGENGKYDILPLPTLLIDDLKSFINFDTKYVFSDKPNTFKVELYNYYKLINYILNWDLKGGVHLFRHTFITKLSEYPNLPPQIIQSLSRHVRPESTSLYIHRNDESLKSAVNNLNYF